MKVMEGSENSIDERGPHIVYLVNDAGQIAWSFFSEAQWDMIRELVDLTGGTIWEVLQEVVIERITGETQ